MFYRNGDRFMVVAVNTQPAFSAGSPRPLFQRRGIVNTVFTGYDVSLDGQRFLIVEPVASQARVAQIEVVMNWFTEVEAPRAGEVIDSRSSKSHGMLTG